MKTESIVVTTMFVFLLHFFTIAQEVRIEPNTKITIESGTIMDITSGNLVLESDVNGDVSLIVKGEVEINNSGKTITERYLSGSAQVWHMLGAPVSGMAISGSDFEPGIDVDDFYAWDEPSPGTWVNYKVTSGDLYFSQESVNNGDNFLPCKGYLIAYDASSPTKIFSGVLNTGDVTFNLKNSGSKSWTYNTGINLISNPYSSAIDWNNIDRTEFQDEYAYVYDPNKSGGEGYVSVNGEVADAFIGSNQGFFVLAKTSANNTELTFTSDMQTHGGGAYCKGITNNEDKLILRLKGNDYYDETKIRLNDESTYNRDRSDAIKMNSYNVNVPNLYTISADNINLAVNSISEIEVENSIAVGVVIPKYGEYTISITEVSEYISSNAIYLHDKLLNNWHKLSQSDYVFTTETGDIANRFAIHFGVTDINDNNAEMLNIWAYNNTLNIISETKQASLQIFDIQGRLISSKTINIDGKYSEILNLQAGVYIVRLQNNNMLKSKQIILN